MLHAPTGAHFHVATFEHLLGTCLQIMVVWRAPEARKTLMGGGGTHECGASNLAQTGTWGRVSEAPSGSQGKPPGFHSKWLGSLGGTCQNTTALSCRLTRRCSLYLPIGYLHSLRQTAETPPAQRTALKKTDRLIAQKGKMADPQEWMNSRALPARRLAQPQQWSLLAHVVGAFSNLLHAFANGCCESD